MPEIVLDETDRRIVNELQGGFPVSARPFRTAARRMRINEVDLIARVKKLLANGVLTRFGPLFQIERAGGHYVLCAMQVPADRFDEVAATLGAMREVAHNYERTHALNMWFVVAAETQPEIDAVLADIATKTGIEVIAMPKLREYFLDLRFAV